MAVIVISVAGALIVVVILFNAYTQAKERAARLRMEKINKTYQQINQFESLLSSVPTVYMPKNVKLLLINQVVKGLELAKSLGDNNSKLDAKIADADELKGAVREGSDEKIGQAIRSLSEGQMVKTRVKRLGLFIKQQSESGQLKGPEKVNCMLALEHTLVRVSIETTLAQADECKSLAKYHGAMLHYKRALDVIRERGVYADQAQVILDVEKSIAEMRAKEELPTKTKTVTESGSSGSSLGSEWDSMLEEEQSWKKKSFDDSRVEDKQADGMPAQGTPAQRAPAAMKPASEVSTSHDADTPKKSIGQGLE